MAGGAVPPVPTSTASQKWQLRITLRHGFLFSVLVILVLVLVLMYSRFLQSQVTAVQFAGSRKEYVSQQVFTTGHGINDLHSHSRYDLNKTSRTSVDPMAKFYSVWQSSPSGNSGRNRKTIVIWTKWWGTRLQGIQNHYCPSMPECIFTGDHGQIGIADAVVFHYIDTPKVYSKLSMPPTRLDHQYWVWFAMECPVVTRLHNLISYSGIFNWTMTYRNASDVSTAYSSVGLIYKKLNEKQIKPNKDYSLGKKRRVVWFVSNCYKYLPRFAYAKELLKHIAVDVFGKCGKVICAKKDFECSNNVINQYKFYLSFESYKCKEYITEKFWRNAIENEVVPVVLGSPKTDYERFAPPGSFIHVDDFESPKNLADYLKILDKDSEKYNQYFRWRTHPPKTVPEDYGRWCNLCWKLHHASSTERKVYTDLDRWWKGENSEFCEPLVLVDRPKDPEYAVHFDENS